jgi:3-methyl-2-oxobutanoate hydroxymethyltransferase
MAVLEHIPDALAATMTRTVPVPTIGIGAGAACDDQVSGINDALGLGDRWPPFSRQYAHLGAAIVEAVASFVSQGKDRSF